MSFTVEIVLRLLLAGLLGGIIGYEREHINRPAGFRTHILVCVGSALVMITSEFIFSKYSGLANVDPARLGAQVISGIGFLGAGTIIRDGFNVRGLTTAASLWAVSCVGIASGIGFYEGAVAATLLIFITLISLKKAEKFFSRKSKYRTLLIECDDISGLVGEITRVMEKFEIQVKTMELFRGKENGLTIKVLAKLPGSSIDLQLVSDLKALDGIKKVSQE